MHGCCTSIYLHSVQFPWYTAGPQHLLSLQHIGKIHICPSSFTFSIPLSPFLLLLQHQFTALSIPDDGWDTDYYEGSVYALPLFTSTLRWSCPPPAGPATTPEPAGFNNPSTADGTFLYRPKTLILFWLMLITKPGPPPSSCVIRQLK